MLEWGGLVAIALLIGVIGGAVGFILTYVAMDFLGAIPG